MNISEIIENASKFTSSKLKLLQISFRDYQPRSAQETKAKSISDQPSCSNVSSARLSVTTERFRDSSQGLSLSPLQAAIKIFFPVVT